MSGHAGAVDAKARGLIQMEQSGYDCVNDNDRVDESEDFKGTSDSKESLVGSIIPGDRLVSVLSPSDTMLSFPLPLSEISMSLSIQIPL